MTATTILTVSERLNASAGGSAFRDGHIINIYNWLEANRAIEKLTSEVYTHNINNRWELVNFIKKNWKELLIDNAHYTVQRSYNNNERVYKRGRPKGSKNRNAYTMKDATNLDVDGLDEIFSDSTEEIKTEVPTTYQPDLSKFVLKTELARDITNVLEQTTKVLHNYCTSNFDKAFNLANVHTDKLHNLSVALSKIQDNRPTVVSLERKELAPVNLGVQHKHFPELLQMCNASLRNNSHLNVWIYGPAGTGKSTAAELVAKALELDFYTNGKLATEYAVLGFINVSGYQSTEFRKAYELGGIYLADEIDGSMPDALLALNGALANGHCVFPDKVVTRHPNFIFLAAANTTGTGATIDYVGRFKQDAAFNDRFVFLDWPLDEGLEDSLVADKTWLLRVRDIRKNIAKVGIKGHLITPRAAIYGEALLASGLSIDRVEQSVLKKGLSEAQWTQIK